MSKFTDYEKARNIILSCILPEHLEGALKYLNLYYNKWGGEVILYKDLKDIFNYQLRKIGT